jgi:hypothetical protein
VKAKESKAILVSLLLCLLITGNVNLCAQVDSSSIFLDVNNGLIDISGAPYVDIPSTYYGDHIVTYEGDLMRGPGLPVDEVFVWLFPNYYYYSTVLRIPKGETLRLSMLNFPTECPPRAIGFWVDDSLQDNSGSGVIKFHFTGDGSDYLINLDTSQGLYDISSAPSLNLPLGNYGVGYSGDLKRGEDQIVSQVQFMLKLFPESQIFSTDNVQQETPLSVFHISDGDSDAEVIGFWVDDSLADNSGSGIVKFFRRDPSTLNVPSEYATIQDAINNTLIDDTVLVASGTYHERINFIGRPIQLKSEEGAETTIIDGDSLGSVVTFTSWEDSTSILDGFTITNGKGWQGGGIYAEYSSPTIKNNIITNNKAKGYWWGEPPVVIPVGGGIYSNTEITILNNIIANNLVKNGWDCPPYGTSVMGGGIYCGPNSIIKRNLIGQNDALTGTFVPTYAYGSGVYAQSGAIVKSNIIVSNYSAGQGALGGGIYSEDAIVENNMILYNTTSAYDPRYGHGNSFGAGIYQSTSVENYKIKNNIIVKNTVRCVNCDGYEGGYGGGGIAFSDSMIGVVENYNDVWENYYSNPEYGDSLLNNYYNCNPGPNDLSIDPLFIDPANNDYHLKLDSPCIDAGDPIILDACRPPGLKTERSDMGSYGGEANCGWPLESSVHLLIWPDGPVIIPKSDYLDFCTYIRSTRDNIVEGDYWLSVLLPDSSEALIPESFLNYPNPLTGQIFPQNDIDMDNELWVPTLADTGSYSLIGRIGVYPDNIIDEESFGFQVVE